MLKYASLTCVFVSLFAGALSAQTVPVSSEVETSAVVGIAFGETAQFNVLNPGVQAPATGVICNATVSYIGGDGTVLKTSTVSVAPGKSAAVFLHSDTDLSLASGGRREIRAQISVPAIVPPPTASGTVVAGGSCSLVTTLEIFDTISGRTEVVVGKMAPVPSIAVTPAQ